VERSVVRPPIARSLVVAPAWSDGRGRRRDARRTICPIQSIRRLAGRGAAPTPLLAANCAHEPGMVSTPRPTAGSRRYDDARRQLRKALSVSSRCRRQITILFRDRVGFGGGHSGRLAHYAVEETEGGGEPAPPRLMLPPPARRSTTSTTHHDGRRRPEIARRPTERRLRRRASAMMEIDPLRPISGAPTRLSPVRRSPFFCANQRIFFSAAAAAVKIIARRSSVVRRRCPCRRRRRRRGPKTHASTTRPLGRRRR